MNLRTLNKVSAGLVVIAAIVTGTFWLQLRAERAATAALQAQLEATLANQKVQTAAARIDAELPVPTPPAAPAAAAAAAAPAPPKAEATGDSRSAASPIRGLSDAVLLQDPEYRKARLAMLRASLEQAYPLLAEEMELTAEEVERLFTLLAETQLDMTAQTATSSATDPQLEQTAAQIRRNLRAARGQESGSLRALLGDARYSQWQEYQHTRGTRLQASSFANAMAQAGAPLDSTQLRTLTAAMISEEKAMHQALLALGRSVNTESAESRAQAQEALRIRQAESNQRILDAAAPRLNSQQLGLLRAQIEQQEAMRLAAERVRQRAAQVPVPQ